MARVLDARRRHEEPVHRKAEEKIECCPDKASATPTCHIVQQRRQRPAQGRCEAGEERNAGDGATGVGTVKCGQGRESGIIEPKSHTDAENRPGAE
jgi:hypothetical protein